MKLLLLTVLLSLAFACVQREDAPSPENIIVNGYTAANHEAPYIVGLHSHNEGTNKGASCCGVIIHNTWVLTAAHCVRRDWVEIYYGSNKRFGGHSHEVHKSNFFKRRGYDIALIRTPYQDFNSKVNKVALPNKLSYKNEMAKACGWGRMANGKLAEQLQCVELQIITNKECKKVFPILDAAILCVSTANLKSTCSGDSGGPLVTMKRRPVLVGITSFTYKQNICMTGKPAGFARVSFHLDWIRKIRKKGIPRITR